MPSRHQRGNQKVGREKEIHIFWVPDHMGIKGYEMTDELTKDEVLSAWTDAMGCQSHR